MIVAHDLSHSFESTLFSGVNLRVKAGMAVAILGVSGSGKSTLINNLSTLLPPLKGKVALNGVADIYAKSPREILEIRRRDIGIIFQSHYLFRGFSALENLQVSAILAGQSIDMGLLESFDIAHTLRQQISELSGGQQQRLSIARVLGKKPKIIFADEPTGNLDGATSKKVMRIVFDYIKSRNAAMLIATHDEEIASLCDEKWRLKDCKLLQCG